MKYTWKVAMETLRTVPPIFGSFRTTIKDIEYQGYHIPKGWQVFTAQIVTHLDAKFFDDPRKFDPARFHNQSSIPPYCFVPFGGGPRMCPGNEFARTEKLVAMHYLVRQFMWKLCSKEEIYRKDPTPMPVLGLPIELEAKCPSEYARTKRNKVRSSIGSMAATVAVALLVAILTPLIVYLVRTRTRPPRRNLPPGSLGLPLIGQSLGLLRAMRRNDAERWVQERIERYGPVSKLSLFGAPTVLLAGAAANKLLFLHDALAPKQPRSLAAILGRRNILELTGDDHRRVRGALMQFLKPDMLRRYVGKIDGEVRRHFAGRWAGGGGGVVTVLPLMKTLTFDIIATLLFGLDRGEIREQLAAAFAGMLEGMWSVPVDLPFTPFRNGLRASERARRILEATVREKKANLEQGKSSPSDDLISCLVSLRDGDDDGRQLLTEEEIVDNAMLALVAGHDTSAILLTFIIRHLATDPTTLAAMAQGKFITTD
uniref:Cytochrome P450 n=1 Tax=Leersia perrieri TaxID=77586 RepID=A0A0D9WZJ3_9ORYZ